MVQEIDDECELCKHHKKTKTAEEIEDNLKELVEDYRKRASFDPEYCEEGYREWALEKKAQYEKQLKEH